MQQKKILRRQFLQKRKALTLKEWQLKSQQICHNLRSNSLFSKAQTILGYFSYRREPDLSLLFTEKQWGFSRCHNNSLTWHYWQTPQPLEANQYDILEPLETAPQIEPQQVDLILIPAVACDRSGYRLGYGGGYYDRLLSDTSWRKIPTVGIVFDLAYVTQLPTETWDISLDYVCTESGIIK